MDFVWMKRILSIPKEKEKWTMPKLKAGADFTISWLSLEAIT